MRPQLILPIARFALAAIVCLAVLAGVAGRAGHGALPSLPAFVEIGGVLAPICTSAENGNLPGEPGEAEKCCDLCLNSAWASLPAAEAASAALLWPRRLMARLPPAEIMEQGPRFAAVPIRGPPHRG